MSAGVVASHYVATVTGSYPGTVLADSPMVYYRLGEPSGTVMADASGNARNGTYEGPPFLGVAGLLTGDTDTAMRVNGAGQRGRVSVATYPVMKTSNLTVSALVKATNVNGTVAARYSNGDTGGASWTFRLESGSQIALWIRTAAATWISAVSPTGAIVAGTTYHLAGTFDGTTMRVYKNGVEIATTAATASINPGTADLYIGSEGSNTERLVDGVVDEVAVWGTALSAARISAQAAAR